MMFKFSVVLLAVVLTVVLADTQKVLQEGYLVFTKAREECYAELAKAKVDSASLARLKAGNATDEDKVAAAKRELCVNVKMGVQKPNGDYEIFNIRKGMEDVGIEKTKIDEAVATCGTRPAGSSAEKAGLALTKCIYETMHKKKYSYN